MQYHFCSVRRVFLLSVCAFGLLAPNSAFASFANSLGGAYGGTLRTNKNLRTQQLTGDPASILRGSMSTEYDPSLVSLFEIEPGPVFDITALIGIRLLSDPPATERFVSNTQFFSGLPFPYVETGYLQVSFVRKSEAGDVQSIIDPRPGYVLADVDGFIDGDETHALFFEALTSDPTAVASYRLYREDGSRHDVLPDFLTTLDNVTTTEISDATVAAPLPEPACMGILAGAGCLVLSRRRRLSWEKR